MKTKTDAVEMTEALAQRVFLAVVCACTLTFGLAGAIAISGNLGDISDGTHDSASAHITTATSPHFDSIASMQQQLDSAGIDISSSSANLARLTADMEAAHTK